MSRPAPSPSTVGIDEAHHGDSSALPTHPLEAGRPEPGSPQAAGSSIENGDVLGTVAEMTVDTETEFVHSIVLDDGRAFTARLLRLEKDALYVV